MTTERGGSRVGDLYRTPWEPSGIVRLDGIDVGAYFGKDAASVTFVGRHPNGYEDGSPGCYILQELRPLDAIPAPA